MGSLRKDGRAHRWREHVLHERFFQIQREQCLFLSHSRFKLGQFSCRGCVSQSAAAYLTQSSVLIVERKGRRKQENSIYKLEHHCEHQFKNDSSDSFFPQPIANYWRSTSHLSNILSLATRSDKTRMKNTIHTDKNLL